MIEAKAATGPRRSSSHCGWNLIPKDDAAVGVYTELIAHPCSAALDVGQQTRLHGVANPTCQVANS